MKKISILLCSLMTISMVVWAEECKPDTMYAAMFKMAPFQLYPEGAVNGLFSVGPKHANVQVFFSKGNLQYKASQNGTAGDLTYVAADKSTKNGMWRFAEHQYDVMGANQGNLDPKSTQTEWMDLFNAGTSGYDNKYPPYFCAYYSYFTGIMANTYYDWGLYSPISNGGNRTDEWRTMTRQEWSYLFHTRPNADSLRSNGTVAGVPGYIILPDNWKTPAGLKFVAQTKDNTTNTYTASQWSVMEDAGAVFLPAGGVRIRTSSSDPLTLENVSNGYYTIASQSTTDWNCIWIRDTEYMTTPSQGRFGYSVRLVQNNIKY